MGQQPDFLGITLQNGSSQPQSVVLEVLIRQERPSSVLLFEWSTDPFVLQGAIRRLTNRDLASERSDVVITDYEIGPDADDMTEKVAQTGRFPSGTYLFQVRIRAAGGLLLDQGRSGWIW